MGDNVSLIVLLLEGTLSLLIWGTLSHWIPRDKKNIPLFFGTFLFLALLFLTHATSPSINLLGYLCIVWLFQTHATYHTKISYIRTFLFFASLFLTHPTSSSINLKSPPAWPSRLQSRCFQILSKNFASHFATRIHYWN